MWGGAGQNQQTGHPILPRMLTDLPVMALFTWHWTQSPYLLLPFSPDQQLGIYLKIIVSKDSKVNILQGKQFVDFFGLTLQATLESSGYPGVDEVAFQQAPDPRRT